MRLIVVKIKVCLVVDKIVANFLIGAETPAVFNYISFIIIVNLIVLIKTVTEHKK